MVGSKQNEAMSKLAESGEMALPTVDRAGTIRHKFR